MLDLVFGRHDTNFYVYEGAILRLRNSTVGAYGGSLPCTSKSFSQITLAILSLPRYCSIQSGIALLVPIPSSIILAAQSSQSTCMATVLTEIR